LPPHLRPPLGAPARLAWQRQQQQQQRLPSGRQPLPMEPLQRIGIDIDPQPIFFFKNSDGLKHFRPIFGLAEFTPKIENSANLRMTVNNCG